MRTKCLLNCVSIPNNSQCQKSPYLCGFSAFRFSHLFAKHWFNEEMNRIVYDWKTIKTVFGVLPGRFLPADVGGVSTNRSLRRVNPSTKFLTKTDIVIYILSSSYTFCLLQLCNTDIGIYIIYPSIAFIFICLQ